MLKRDNISICLSVTLGALSVGAVPAVAQDREPYVIYISNNYVGNDWRQQMIRSATVAVEKAPLMGRVDLRIENSENTVQAQSNSLNNIIRRQPDAILIDAGSATALNPTIRKACDAGILVISFDQVVTEPCAYTLDADWDGIPRVLAEWMAEQLGGRGNILIDRGLAGTPIATRVVESYQEFFADYPDINIVGYYNADYALGPEQSGVASLLAANPEIDGIITQAYGTGAMQALRDAGRPLVPIVAYQYNLSAQVCAQTEDAKCILYPNPAYMSADAIKLAVDILDSGVRPEQRELKSMGDYLTTEDADVTEEEVSPGARIVKIVVGENAFPDQPPGLSLPVSPSWVDISAAEAAGTN